MYSTVLSSGATIPMRAPISMDMLHSVMRSSRLSASTAGPAYSTADPDPAPAPSCEIMKSAMSLALTSALRLPCNQTLMVRGRR